MGRPPTHGAPSFRFFAAEVAEMETLLRDHGGHVPPREMLMALANKFSNSVERSGKIAVQMKQVWNWFQNRRYALRAKLVKPPGSSNVPPNPRGEAAQVRNVSSVPQQTHFSSGHNVGRNTTENPLMEFEAKSARDGAWYDVQAFLSHRYLETGNPEVLIRFSGFGPEEDEWVNVRKLVRQRSLPCESSECIVVLPGDLILCFQEGKEQALYFDAHVLDAQRRRHDLRGCRCRFLVRYDHDQSEEIVPLRKVCRRPETDYRLQQLHAANEAASASTSVSAESKKPVADPNSISTARVTNPNPSAAVTVPPPTITNVSAQTLISAPTSSSTVASAPSSTLTSAAIPSPALISTPSPSSIPISATAPSPSPNSAPSPSLTPSSAPAPSQTLISAPSPSPTSISAPTPSPTLIFAPSPSSTPSSTPAPSQTLISAPSPSPTSISAPTPSPTLIFAPSPSSTPSSAPTPSVTLISAQSSTPVPGLSPSPTLISAPSSSLTHNSDASPSPALNSAPSSTPMLAPSASPSPISAPSPTPISAPSLTPVLAPSPTLTPISASSPTLISAPTSSPTLTPISSSTQSPALTSAPSVPSDLAPTPAPVPISFSPPVAAPEVKRLESDNIEISPHEASAKDINSGATSIVVESKKEEVFGTPETSVVDGSGISQKRICDNPTVPVAGPEKVGDSAPSEPTVVVSASTN